MIKNVLIGADPEFTLYNGYEYISAEGMIGGSKRHPISIDNGCFAQEDNVGVEFNIPPAKTSDEFVESIEYALGILRKQIPAQFEFSWTPCADFNPMFLQTKQASISGCEKDENIYGLPYKIPRLRRTSKRAFGAHLHFGYDDPNTEWSRAIIAIQDVFVNIPTLKFEDEQASIERRKLYGKAGSYRIKSYGVEYRSLSSWWLAGSETIKLIYDLANSAIGFLNYMGIELYHEILSDAEHIIKAINFHDKKSVKYIMSKYSIKNV